MGVFTIALSAWAATTMVAQSNRPASLEPEAEAISTTADEGLRAEMPQTLIGGFRMEGEAELEVVFGDLDRYKKHLDSFFAIHNKMTAARKLYSVHAKAAVSMLSEHPRGKRCPHEELGPHYFVAHKAGDDFRALGSGLEREYVVIRRHDRFGDTDALTPDYRWKVNRTRALYARSLTDYKEMRYSFLDQVGAEVGARGCSKARLLTLGREAPATAPAEVEAPYRAPNRRRRPSDKIHETSQIPATFFIDNKGCGKPMQVYVDGQLVGEVAGNVRTAFQTTTGQHTLCLIETGSVKQCGEPGTLRSAYFHEGWSVALHCQ
jgi:hypothetical protein